MLPRQMPAKLLRYCLLSLCRQVRTFPPFWPLSYILYMVSMQTESYLYLPPAHTRRGLTVNQNFKIKTIML
jgi:hypothetical protein